MDKLLATLFFLPKKSNQHPNLPDVERSSKESVGAPVTKTY